MLPNARFSPKIVNALRLSHWREKNKTKIRSEFGWVAEGRGREGRKVIELGNIDREIEGKSGRNASFY